MSRGWKPSKLFKGEEVYLPDDLFQTNEAKERIVKSVYIGENECGLWFECEFQKGFATQYPQWWKYKIMIPWASIYCGNVKVRQLSGKEIRAERLVDELAHVYRNVY
jgi:hypothetical protein